MFDDNVIVHKFDGIVCWFSGNIRWFMASPLFIYFSPSGSHKRQGKYHLFSMALFSLFASLSFSPHKKAHKKAHYFIKHTMRVTLCDWRPEMLYLTSPISAAIYLDYKSLI